MSGRPRNEGRDAAGAGPNAGLRDAGLVCKIRNAYGKRAYDIIAAMSDYNFERSFGFVLHETARLLSKRFDQQARRFGLTRAQCAALVFLSRNEGINQAGLAELLEMEPISLTRLIDRMEQAGWVERRLDPSDRRARRLFMTDKAKPIFAQILEAGLVTRTEALAGLSERDRDQLIDLLLRVRANLTQKAPSANIDGAAALHKDPSDLDVEPEVKKVALGIGA